MVPEPEGQVEEASQTPASPGRLENTLPWAVNATSFVGPWSQLAASRAGRYS
ncbi:hypothetical protein J6590_006567 [Homalodisca vitripennis]|nr:hypothetical protein J6590_006567 [Homalodisca vitripennis]